MEPVNNDGMCRCCASEGTFKDLQSTYLWMGIGEVYSDMIKDCFDISLSTSISGNGGICEVCITQLRNACNFKKQVEQTEEQFRRRLADSEFRANVLKIEVPPDDEDHDADNDPFEGTMSDEFSGPEYDIPLKNIKIEKEIEKPKKRAAKPSTSKAKKPKAEDGEPSVKRRQPRIITLQKSTRLSNRRVITLTSTPRIQVLSRQAFEIDQHQENIKILLLYSNATPIHYKGRVGFDCCFCTRQFEEPSQLKVHTITQHDNETKSNYMKGCSILSYIVRLDITGLKCTECDTEMSELEILIEHIRTVHKINYNTDINNHIVPFRFEREALCCVYCYKTFNHFKGLTEHMNIHYRNYVCDVCDAGFVNKRTLRTHGYRHKTGVFNCTTCSKVFDTRIKRRDHEMAVHINPKRSKCTYCQERFVDYTKKKEHEVIAHGAKRIVLVCRACEKTFESQRALRFHTKYYHLMQKRSRHEIQMNKHSKMV